MTDQGFIDSDSDEPGWADRHLDREFFDDRAVPTHYRDNGQLCSGGGTITETGRCARGGDHADHYSNDGHRACQDTSGEPGGPVEHAEWHPLTSTEEGRTLIDRLTRLGRVRNPPRPSRLEMDPHTMADFDVQMPR